MVLSQKSRSISTPFTLSLNNFVCFLVTWPLFLSLTLLLFAWFFLSARWVSFVLILNCCCAFSLNSQSPSIMSSASVAGFLESYLLMLQQLLLHWRTFLRAVCRGRSTTYCYLGQGIVSSSQQLPNLHLRILTLLRRGSFFCTLRHTDDASLDECVRHHLCQRAFLRHHHALKDFIFDTFVAFFD